MRKLLALALLLIAIPAMAAGPSITATVVTSGTADAQGVAAATNLRLVGYSITENAGSPAVARLVLRNGTTTGGAEMFDVQIAASSSTVQWFGVTGPRCPLGIFVDRVSGTTKLTLYTIVY